MVSVDGDVTAAEGDKVDEGIMDACLDNKLDECTMDACLNTGFAESDREAAVLMVCELWSQAYAVADLPGKSRRKQQKLLRSQVERVEPWVRQFGSDATPAEIQLCLMDQ